MIRRISLISVIALCIFSISFIAAYADTDIVLTEDTEIDKIEDVNINISGAYKLTVNNGIIASGNVTIKGASVYVKESGIYADGNIVIENAYVDSYASLNYDHHGPRAISAEKGTVTINNSEVHAAAGEYGSYLINAEAGFKAEGSTIYLGNGNDCSCGITANSESGADVEMKDCTVNANLKDGDGINSYRGNIYLDSVVGELYTGSEGISGHDIVQLTNCRIFIEGGKDEPGAGMMPDGLWAYGDIIINGGWLKVSSALGEGIYANDNITISADTEYVEASGKDGAIKVGTSGKITLGSGLTITTPAGGSIPEGSTVVVDKDGFAVNKVVIQGKSAIDYDTKKANPLNIKAKTHKVKYRTLKKKSVTLKKTQILKIVNIGKGTKQYKIVSGNKKISINKSTGKVTIKKGLKKGKYPVRIKVTAKGTTTFKSKTITVKSTIRVI